MPAPGASVATCWASPLFGDEAFVARTFQLASFDELAQPLRHEMVVPYGFLVLTWVTTRVAGLSEWALRFWPTVCGLVGLWLWVRTFRERLGGHQALLASALLAASYYPARHAAELKPYALDFLAAALIVRASLAWHDACGARDRRRLGRARWAWIGITATAVWFSYPAAFTAGGAWLVLAAEALRRRAQPRTWMGLGVALAILLASFGILYRAVAGGQQWSSETIAAGQWAPHFPPHAWAQFPQWLARELTGRMFAYPNGGSAPGSIATTVLVAVGAWVLVQRRRAWLVGLCLAPLLPMLVAAWLERYPFGGSARVHQHLAGPLCLLCGVGLVRVFALIRAGSMLARVSAALLALVPLVHLAEDLRAPYKHRSDQRCRSAARALTATSDARDRWVVWGGFEERAAGSPDWHPLGGSAARLAFYLSRDANAPLVWGGGPETWLKPTPTSSAQQHARVRLLVYRDNDEAFDEEGWRRQLGLWEARLGPAQVSSFVLGPSRAATHDQETLDVYDFVQPR